MQSETPVVQERRSGPALTRRSVVRAGAGAVWAAPAVTLVTAAPALAASSTLTISGFVGTFENSANAATVNPHRLVVSATLGNTGAAAATGVQFTLVLPANLYGATPSATTPSGFSAPSVTGSLAAGWTLVFTAAAPIASGDSVAFSTVVTFTDTDAAPYRRWAGHAFALTGLLSASGATTASAVTPVAESVSTTLQVTGWTARRTRFTDELWVGDTDGGGTPSAAVVNTGRKTCGRVTLSVVVPDTTGRYSEVAGTPPDSIAAGWEFVARTPASNTTGPWTYTFRTTATEFGPDDFSATANATTARFRARIYLRDAVVFSPGTVNITATASAPYATNSATVQDDAED